MIEANPFNKCKECVHEYCGQANMPCRACTFGSKFERALIIPKHRINWKDITFDVTKLVPTEKIIKNVDKHSIYPDTSIFVEYCKHDVEATKKLYDILNRRKEELKGRRYVPEIKRAIFNEPYTIVIWEDKTKTIVKTQGDELYDPEKGLTMAICKRLYGNKGSYFDHISKWTDPYYKKKCEEKIAELKASNDIQKAAVEASTSIENVMKAISDAVNNNKV